MTGNPSPSEPRWSHALDLVARRRAPVEPGAAVAGFFHRVPTTLELWNSVPGVVKLVHCDPSPDGAPVVAAEPVDGTPFSELTRLGRVPDAARAVRLALALGEIVESLHNNGLVHGDLRPDTVLVTGDDDAVLLLPPPLATLAARAQQPDMRPSERADVQAFGRVLYDLLASVLPRRRGRSVAAAAWSATPVPLGKRGRRIAPPLERLVMETLTFHRAELDMSEVVNRLWIERERLRGRGAHPDVGRRTGELRRLAAVAAVATFVTASWLSAGRAPVPPTRPDRQPVLAKAGSPAIPDPPAPLESAPDRDAAEIAAPSRPVVAARSPAAARGGAPGRPSRPAPPAPTRRHEARAVFTVEPPPRPPEPPMVPAEAPAMPPELPPPPVASPPGPAAAAGLAPRSPAHVEPTLTASQRSGELAEAVPAPPLLSTVREDEAPRSGPLAPRPEVAVAAVPASTPTDTLPAVGVMLVRGAPGPGAEAGASALSTGYGASGAGGIIEGRLGPVGRATERPPSSGLASRLSSGSLPDRSPGR